MLLSESLSSESLSGEFWHEPARQDVQGRPSRTQEQRMRLALGPLQEQQVTAIIIIINNFILINKDNSTH